MSDMDATETGAIATVVASRVEAIVAAAEHAAHDFREQIERQATEHAKQVHEAAQADARQITHEAASRAANYLGETRRIIDAFAAERIARISALTDALIEQTGLLERRFTEGETVRRQVYDLIASLGVAAEAVARETQSEFPALPALPERPESPERGR